MTLRFLILSSSLFTRNLRIDKNFTLSIFMFSGSIQLYSNFQFIMTCIYHKPCVLYQTILMLIHFHMLSLYKSLVISKYAFSHAFNLQTQIMRFKHILPRMYLVYKSIYTHQVYYFTLSIQFTFMTDSIR